MSSPRRAGGRSRTAGGGESPRPDADDFLELYQAASPAVYAWARLHILPPIRRRLDPEDVLQEVCARALARFSTYDRERPFRAWLFGIAHNVLREALRAVRTRGESIFVGGRSTIVGLEGVAAEATGISTRVAREEGLLTFLDKVSNLEAEEKRLLLYRGLEGRRHEEVAEILNISHANAEKRWQRLLAKLRKAGAPQGLIQI